MDDRMKHFAAHPYYLLGRSNERNRIITDIEIYLASLSQPSYSINITTLRKIIDGDTK